tara:strand:+ start:878 stop:1258 length:381 start_codon:yes stop_codon:yes gene_type:complete
MSLKEDKENIIKDNNILERKRTKTVSKHGNMYYKTSLEVNRIGQHKHYLENKESIATKSILARLETTGSIPQFSSIKKYPLLITEETIMKGYRIFNKKNNDPEKFIIVKKKLMVLLKKLENYNLSN